MRKTFDDWPELLLTGIVSLAWVLSVVWDDPFVAALVDVIHQAFTH